MVKDKTTIRSTESISDLEAEKRELEEKLKAKRRAEAEVMLIDAVEKMKNAEEDIAEVLTACYKYIGTHRRLV